MAIATSRESNQLAEEAALGARELIEY